MKIRTLIFNVPLQLIEVPYFRKAITSLVSKLRTQLQNSGVNTDLFHNHDEITGKPINRYPLVQYKTESGYAAISGIKEGADAVQALLDLLSKKENEKMLNHLHLHGKSISFALLSNHEYEYNVVVSDKLKNYKISDWLPFEEERYTAWSESLSLEHRVSLLNEALPRQISNFLTGLNFTEEISYTAFIDTVDKTEWLKEFNVHKLAFDCSFWSNLELPDGIGLGQVPSIGFGKIVAI